MDWLISADIKVGIRGGDVKGRHMRAPKMCKDPPAWGYTKETLKMMIKNGKYFDPCYKPSK